MSAQPPSLQHLAASLLSRVSPRMAGVLQAGARARLLKRVDTVLLLHNDRLFDLGNGAWQTLKSGDTAGEAAQTASAAAALLDAREKAPSVLLLLPSSCFIATEVSMPGVVGENLRSALQLQSSVLLPSYDAPLAFAVDSSTSGSDSPNIVLWTDEARLDELFVAFEQQGLFLAGVMPRVLVSCDRTSGESMILDEDADTSTSVVCREGVLTRFLQIPKQDLQDDAFARQWRDATGVPSPDSSTRVFSDAQAYVDLEISVNGDSAYCFVPEGARKVMQRAEKGRRAGVAIAASFALLILAALPFLWQSVQMLRLQSQLSALQENSVQAREDQAAVRAFEQNWGVLNDYPKQTLPETLLQMQSVLSPSALTSVEIEEGSVEIEGESQDPQSLLQLLEENSLFTGADFARATNNNRYYIEFRLSTVDYDAYRARYFPHVRR